MRRSRVSEMPQRPSLRVPLQRRSSSSETDQSYSSMTGRHSTVNRPSKPSGWRSPQNNVLEQRTSVSESMGSMINRRPPVDRNSKFVDRCSPRNPLVEKKLRTRIFDLESQLGQVQEELKNFKEQLALAEFDRSREVIEIENMNGQMPVEFPSDTQAFGTDSLPGLEKSTQESAASKENLKADVFEIPHVAIVIESDQNDSDEHPDGSSVLVAEPKNLVEPLHFPEETEISLLKVKLAEKEMEIVSVCAENNQLKQQVSKATAKVSKARSKEEETSLKLNGMGEELEMIKAEAAQVMEELKAAVEAKVVLETEMKKLKAQTEQWKKAACTAASVVAGEVEVCGQSGTARSSKILDDYAYVGRGGIDSVEDLGEGLESVKAKGPGIRLFGEFLKRKGK